MRTVFVQFIRKIDELSEKPFIRRENFSDFYHYPLLLLIGTGLGINKNK